MDLDDDELKATRILNGTDKTKRKINDIEDAIRELKSLSPSEEAINYILSERKQDKEIIKKLKLIIEIKDKLNRLDLHKENTTLVLEKVLKTLSRKDIRDD